MVLFIKMQKNALVLKRDPRKLNGLKNMSKAELERIRID